MHRFFLAAVLLLLFHNTALADIEIKVGSKKFTESVILGEALTLMARAGGFDGQHRKELGGTRVLFEALKAGDIDLYVEYTGTLRRELFAQQAVETDSQLQVALAEQGLRVTRSLGFNNTYAVGMLESRAAALGIRTISDLRDHPGLRFGFGNEFMNRGDGWPALRSRYRLPRSNVSGLDHDLAYRGLATDNIDAMDIYTTDAKIAHYGIRLLEDDLGLFPAYQAVILYRAELAERAPDFLRLISLLEGAIDEPRMAALNARVDLDGDPDTVVAADFLRAQLGIEAEIAVETMWSRLWRHTIEHLGLVVISLSAAIVLAIPLGIIAQRRQKTGQAILSIVGLIQTIPSLALFVFMIPLVGIGGPPAMLALFLYSLLPIVRSTHAGLHDIPASIRESAEALGLPEQVILWKIELPLAGRAILSGIKTSAVINVGTASLGALIGAGGYGQPILTGIRLDDMGLILEGAIPAAALALVVQGGFELLERAVVPKGLRLRPTSPGA